MKEKTLPCTKKTRTVGVLLGMWNCGIISSYRSLYGSEGIAQVFNFMLDVINISPESIPKFLAYDTACQLKQYSLNQITRLANNDIKSERLEHLNEIKMIVDKFHFSGHTGKFCKEHCNPNEIPEINKLNTEACEQCNAWLYNYKHILNNMNLVRFSFFLFCLLDDYNFAKLNFKHLFIH